MAKLSHHICALLAMGCALFPRPVLAQDATTGGVSIELNTVTQAEGACTLTFVITNANPGAIDKLVYETVLFDTGGQVTQLTLFDFGALPPALPRVRQFAVADVDCASLERILFNGMNTCEAPSDSVDICGNGISPSSRTDIEVLG